MNLFVYYKLIESEYPNLRIKVQLMQSDLQYKYPSVSTQLMKRPEADQAGHATWMEMYDLSEVDISIFRAELDQLALAAGLPQPRKNEIFIHI